MKKTLKIILIIAIVLVLGLLGWFWLFPGSSGPAADKIKDILPFGTGEGVNIPTTDNQQPTAQTEEAEAQKARFFQISKEPVAGFVAFNPIVAGRVSTTTIRYVDRATGHIYDVDPLTLRKTKVTNKTLPKVYEAHFRDNGNSVLVRSLVNDSDTIENLSLTLTPPKTTSTTTGNLYSVSATNLRGDIKEAVAGSGDSLFYVAEDSGSIISSTFNGTNLRTLFNSSFTDWRLAPYGQNLMIYTRASSGIPGYAYRLSSNGALTKILGPYNGLMVTPNQRGGIAYSYVDNGKLSLFIKASQGSEDLSVLPTFAEKCTWSKKTDSIVYCAIPSKIEGRNEPENWYKGISHYADRVWVFNASTEISDVLIDPKKTLGIDMDVVNPTLSSNEDYLVFINKNDLSLWALRLED